MKKIIIANWKMNPSTTKEAEKLFTAVVKSVGRIERTEVVICAPFVYLEKLSARGRSALGGKKISLGGQDAFDGDVGPYTGEVSSEMLYNLGARYVILGHSERRALGETNEVINRKIKGALFAGLVPIVCVGEKERDESHGYFNLVKTQVVECLNGISKNLISKIIIAYEPVWSISSTIDRRDATSADSREMAVFIRKILSDITSPEIASKTRVIYGGSVTEKDTGDFLENGGVDGVLPGRASLDAKKFIEIVKICEALKN